MIEIDDKIVSADLLRECFACDLGKCKGICCVEGDAGAPLDIEEVDLLEEEYDNYFKPIDPGRRDEVLLTYDEEWINEVFLPKLTYLAQCLKEGRFPVCE